MKVLLQTLICCILTISMYAQKNHPTPNTQAEKTNWINFKTAEQTSAAQLAENKTVLYLQEKDNLNLIAEQTDQLGMRHYRYQQTYDGIPIEGAIYIFHEKENRVKTANGKLVHQLNLNTLPSISVDAALTFALAHIDAELYAWDDPMHENGIKEVKNQPDATFYPSGKLVIIDPEFKQQNTNCQLAYKFDIYAIQPYTRQEVFVDAHNGSIITTIEKIHNCNDMSATGTSNYHGDVSFTACQHDGTYTLKNNIGGGMQVFYDNYEGDGTEYSEYPFTSESSFFQNIPEAIDVHWATEATYNYFLDTLGRNSLDNDGMLLKSWVHRGDNLNNAAWTGWCMFYGDGDSSQYGSWTSSDIVAHEMAHGVTEYSANLIYQYESGALNESFSDIFGEMVEWAATGTNDWLIGADVILTPGINGLRNMSNPKAPDAKFQQPDTYNGEYWYTGSGNYGGVHTNSGVQNYWFYLLSEGGSGTNDNGYTYDISGIGKTKAAVVAYLNLTQYLTRTSNYADARVGSMAAAQDLQLSPQEVQTIEDAWCAVGVGCGTFNSCIENDSIALIELYNTTNGTNWTNTWDLNQPMNTWYGVNVDAHGCVVELNVSGNQLSGNIPSEIGNLSKLRYLYLYNNQLSGNIPPEVGNLSDLVSLHLEQNQLTGNIPPEIGNLGKLALLYLGQNQLTGSIPPEIGNLSNLEFLLIEQNQLTGNIPPEIGNLSNLLFLQLEQNQLTGNIPPEIGNFYDPYGDGLYPRLNNNQLSGCYDISLRWLCAYSSSSTISDGNNFDESWDDFCSTSNGSCPPFDNIDQQSDSLALVALYNATSGINWTNSWNLNEPINTWAGVGLDEIRCVGHLSLDNNNLVGTIPPEIGNLSCLTSLRLNNNQLSGNIPSEIGNLIRLRFLYLDGNQLSGNIPSEIGNLKLQNLYLNINQLTGNIPPEIWDMNNLISLRLNTNQLTGNIPPEISNLNNLRLLHLANNQLTDNIPSEIGNLSNLTELNLSNNQLTGNIPPEIGNLSDLIQLSLSINQLTGNIPPEIGNLSNLTDLNLPSNQLTGNIPPEIGNLGNLIRLYLYHNQLSGNIPSEIGNLSNLTELSLSNNQLTGNIPPKIGNLSSLIRLYLSHNQLSGCYNPNLSNLCYQLGAYIISNSNNFDATWDDFCSSEAGRCPIPPVLPGDFNSDGTVNQDDILYWGLAKDYVGAARPDATTDWIPQECPEWDSYINGVNLHHTDGDGNGIVDNNDLSVLEQNFGLTQDFSVPSESPSSSVFLMSQLSNEPWGYNTKITYELYLQSDVPISTHGISGSIDLSDVPNIVSASIDTTGSVLRPDAYIDAYDNSSKVINVGLTKTSKNNELINGSIGTMSIIISKDIQVGDPTKLRTNGGSMISSNGVVTPIAGSTLYIVPKSATPDLPVSLSLNHAYCGMGGTATAYAWEGTAPYTYTWSTGESSASVSNLPIGTHSLMVTDVTGLSKAIDFEIEWAFTPVEISTTDEQICIDFEDAPLAEAVQVSLDNGATYEDSITSNTCYDLPEDTYHLWIQRAADECPVDLGIIEPDCVDVQLYAWMEGAYDFSTLEMKNSLNIHRLLPGQTPLNNLAPPTPAGQPYNTAPWNYTGSEGITWTDADYSPDIVDWVLLSFRTDIEKSTEVAQTAGIIHQDGSITLHDRCGFEAIEGVDSVYVVVQHRNHMGIMTPEKVEIVNGSLTYDFRTADSYRNSTSVGQKQLATGEWVMFAGDADQSDLPSYDIIGTDISIWIDENGSFGNYTVADFNLDGDVNGEDKILWSENNGNSSRVPK